MASSKGVVRGAAAAAASNVAATMPPLLLLLLLLASASIVVDAFASPAARSSRAAATATTPPRRPSSSSLRMASLDPVTYLRTEWVSAALVTNQTPRSADVVLQLGCEDGRIVNFVPRTVREIITSSAENANSPEGGGLTVACSRQLKQQAERRGAGAKITFSDQPADDLSETPSSSVDIVVSLQAARRMVENGLDWKKSVNEACRVLKPGGRFLFVESSELGDGESYLDYVVSLSDFSAENKVAGDEDGKGDMMEAANDAADGEGEEGSQVAATSPIFQEVGYDQVDMVLQPHIAGVAIKAADADLSAAQKAEKKAQEESDRLADLSLSAFERGSKRRKRKKKKKKVGGEEES